MRGAAVRMENILRLLSVVAQNVNKARGLAQITPMDGPNMDLFTY